MYSFGENKQVNSDSDGFNKGRPVTVRDGSDNIVAAWQRGASGSRDIYVGKLTAGADSFGSSIKLADNIADQCNPAIAIDSADKLYVVWQDNRQGDWDVYLSTSVDGLNWSSERMVADSNDNQINPAIVIDSSNKVYIVWEDDRNGNQDIYIAESSNSFVTKTVSQITSNSSSQTAPGIAADSDNTVYVVWTDTRDGSNDIYGAASNSGSWTNVVIVNKQNNQSSPAITAEPTGDSLHLVWVEETAGNKDIYYAVSNGLPVNPLSGSSIIDDTTGAEQSRPTVITNGESGDNLKVFACWQDKRNITGSGGDTDLYFAKINSGRGTNVFVDEDNANSDQSEPAIGIDASGYPYLVWADNRNTYTDIYYAGTTFAESDVLASKAVDASTGATVGTEPAAITGIDDVSVIVPAGACLCDLTITISRIKNPQKLSLECFSVPYEFGPSGIEFSEPVTVTIPYSIPSSGNTASAYWYNPLIGALSQDGITDVEDIVISPTLHALRFKTTHFSQFVVGGVVSGLTGGVGGGCSMMSSGNHGSPAEFLLPYIGLTMVMIILKLRDARNRKANNITKSKC